MYRIAILKKKATLFSIDLYKSAMTTTLTINKRASFDYDLIETFEGGLVLSVAEVKAVKLGQAQLKGSFIFIRSHEAWLKNAFIASYKPASSQQVHYDPNRDRKILLHEREIKRLLGKQTSEGLTIVPLRLYTKQHLVKIELALARGKRKYEKREAIKKRETQQKLREEMKIKRYRS